MAASGIHLEENGLLGGKGGENKGRRWVGAFPTGGFAPFRLTDTHERRVYWPDEYPFSTEIQLQTYRLVTRATQTSASECSHGKDTDFHNIPRKS